MVVGLAVLVAMLLVLNGTKLGLLIRAGVENREMVEAISHPALFVAVFVAGSALAGLGGTLWALYRETLTAGIGSEAIRWPTTQVTSHPRWRWPQTFS
jgi:branched-chain amino acid transport system permease protein